MILLKDNKLINISLKEDSTEEIIAIKTKEQLNSEYAIKSIKYKLIMHGMRDYYGTYNFQVIESQYKDNSSLGDFYINATTKGEAIARMLKDGYKVIIDGKEITN